MKSVKAYHNVFHFFTHHLLEINLPPTMEPRVRYLVDEDGEVVITPEVEDVDSPKVRFQLSSTIFLTISY